MLVVACVAAGHLFGVVCLFALPYDGRVCVLWVQWVEDGIKVNPSASGGRGFDSACALGRRNGRA